MNKVTRLKYYIESLCIYDFEDDDVFSAIYDLLCDDEEDTVALQSYFFKEIAKRESLKKLMKQLISKQIGKHIKLWKHLYII